MVTEALSCVLGDWLILGLMTEALSCVLGDWLILGLVIVVLAGRITGVVTVSASIMDVPGCVVDDEAMVVDGKRNSTPPA